MALPDLSRLAALGSPPLTSDTLAGVVGSNQQNGRWTVSQLAGVIGAGGFSPVISVKDYGATGNGSTDDRLSIQNALDAAFGPASAPHGDANKFLNKPVYFPAGNYKVNGPLYLTNVVSGWIFGAGQNCTRIFYGGSLNGNAVIPNPTEQITASISTVAGGTLTVTAVALAAGVPASNLNYDALINVTPAVLSGAGVTVGTTVTGQLTYTPNGTNGSTTSGSPNFTDATFNAFTSGMIGHRLNIQTGPAAFNNYRIVSFISASQVTLNFNLTTGSGATWRIEGYTGTYSVSPSQTVGSESMNVAAAGSELTPLWMTNGFASSTFERMNLSINGTNTVGIFLFEDGLQGSTTLNTFNDLLIDGSSGTGILAGYQSAGLCSECQYYNVTFGNGAYGLRLRSANALNHNVYGGGAFNCTIAAYSVDQGQINLIFGSSLAGNALDVQSLSNTPISLIGGRTESTNSIVVFPGQIYLSGFIYQPNASGTFVNAAGGGKVVMDACIYAPGTGNGVIVALSNNGLAILNNMISQAQASGSATISGSAGSKLFLRGCSFDNASTLSSFTGAIAENVAAPVTFSTLPTASAAYKGVRMSITDSSVTTFGTNAAGGGSTTVPVYCDGTNWKVG